MATSPIDLSSGLVPKQGGIDLSAGLVPKSDSPAPQKDNRSFTDKALEFISKPAEYFTDHTIGAMDAVKSGQYARAANEGVKAGSVLAAPFIPQAVAAAPLATAVGMGTGIVGGKVAQGVAKKLGATDDQAELAGNVGGLITGLGASKVSDSLPALARFAGKMSGSVDPDLVGLISPRAASGIRWLNKAAQVVGKTGADSSGGLADIVDAHKVKIDGLQQQLADALSKANALPPEGPTAKLTDIPDLRVQPAQQTPMNLMERSKAAFQAARQVTGGDFKVVPPEGQPVAAPQSSTPNGALYNEPIAEKSAQDIYREKFLQKTQSKPTILDQLKQWDQIRQIHSQLEDQIGKGQDDIQQWMEDHNTQAPGGSAAQAKAAPQGGHAGNGVSSVEELSRPGNNYVVSRSGQLTYQGKSFAPESTPNGATHVTVKPDGTFQVNAGPKLNPAQEFALNKALNKPRTPVTDQDLEETIMKSIQNANAKARSAKAGDD